MRTARFLLLIVYVAGHTGLPLPLPGGACVAGACGCGDACQCAQETIAAGECCCAKTAQAGSAAKKCSSTPSASCCSQRSETCCPAESETAGCCDEQEPASPVLRSCGCRQDAPEGITVCSDPRLLPARLGPPQHQCCGWCAPAGDLTAPARVQAPDDPVPRLTA